MNRLLSIIIALLVLVGSSGTASAGILYALNDTNDSLYSIDTNTLAFTFIGSVGVGTSFGGLAYDANSGTLYMVGGRSQNNLYTLDQNNGSSTLIGAHGQTDLFGLAFDTTNNVLYGTPFHGSQNLVSLNTTNGSATIIGNMGTGIGGLAYDSFRDQLVGVRDGSGDLYDINRANGATTLLFNGAFTNDSGLAYDSENDLFWDIDYSGNLFSYDPNNGYLRTTHLTGLDRFTGLAFVSQPIPEPASMTLLGLGLAGLAYRRRNRSA